MLPRWEEASMRLTEGKRIKPLEAEALEAEELETEVLQKQEEERKMGWGFSSTLIS